MDATVPHFSWRFLASVFCIALLLFIGLRWDMTPWLQAQLNQWIQQQHLDIHYDSLERDGLQITLHHVQINDPGLPQPLSLDDVMISPDIWASLGGDKSALLHVRNAFMDVQAQLMMHGNSVDIQDVNADMDVAQAQTWLALPSPVHIHGQLHLEGALNLDASSGVPQSGTWTAVWQQAGASMMSQNYPLGDYHVQSHIAQQTMQWDVHGGEALTLNGQGKVDMSALDMRQWQLKGNVKVKAAEGSPLASFLTSSQRVLIISGNIGHPQWGF